MEPPYWIVMERAMRAPYIWRMVARMNVHTSPACSGVAVRPVPMAHRLISDDAFAQFFGTDASQSGFDLQGKSDPWSRPARAVQALTDADDGMKAGLRAACTFLFTVMSVSPKILTAFAVTDNDVLHAQILQHIGRDFTGICAVFS